MSAEPIVADPNDPAWHAARRSFIGASEAPAILGLSPWATALDVWAVKMGITEDFAGNTATDLGHELEDWIARQWGAATGRPHWSPRTTQRHRDYPHIAASVDRVSGHIDDEGFCPDAELLECKLVGPNVAWSWADGPPIYVVIQVQVQMAVTGAQRAHVCALIVDRGFEWKTWTIGRDDDAIATIIERLDAWWQRHVVGGERAGLEGDPEKVREALQRIYPAGDDSTPIRLDGVAAERIAAIRHAKALRKDLEADIERAENELRAALGDATEGYLDDNSKPAVTWRPQTRTGHNLKAIEDELAGIEGDDLPLQQFTHDELRTAVAVLEAVRTETTTRVLRIAAPPKQKKRA